MYYDTQYHDLIHKDHVTIFDIKMGRGGHASNSEFHQCFLDKKDFLRVLYLEATSNREKRDIQQMLVDHVHGHGGRFIRRVNAYYYEEIGIAEALRKAANALREDRVRYRVRMILDAFEIFHGIEDMVEN